MLDPGSNHDAIVQARRVAAGVIEARLDDLVTAMLAGYQQEIGPYADLDNPSTLAEVRTITRMNVHLILHAIANGEPLSDEALAALRELGLRRAAQGFPLHAILRAYQVGTRIAWPYILEGVERATADPAVARGVVASVSQTILELTGQISGAVTDAFLQAERATAATAERVRRDVFNELLAGPVAGVGPLRERAERVGYRLADYHAVAAVSFPGLDTIEEDDSAAASLVDQTVGALSAVPSDLPGIVESRGFLVYAVFPLASSRPWRALADHVEGALAGVEPPSRAVVLGGLGLIEQGVAGVAASYRQALRALDAARATGSDSRVAAFGELLPVLLLLDSPALAADLWRCTIEPLARHDETSGTQLVATLRTLIEERGNLIAAAKRLFVHRHTLAARLERIEELTARSVRVPGDLLMLGLGLQAARVQPAGRAEHDFDPALDNLSRLRPPNADNPSIYESEVQNLR